MDITIARQAYGYNIEFAFDDFTNMAPFKPLLAMADEFSFLAMPLCRDMTIEGRDIRMFVDYRIYVPRE